jgi:cardiolipin synthase
VLTPPAPAAGTLARVPLRRFTSLLRPLPGRRLPAELQPRKVGRIASGFADGLRDPGFAALLSRIDGGAPIRGGNRVDLYADGQLATTAMIEAIRAAREEVLLESYIFDADATGERYREALVEAAARGVRVRALVDAIGSFNTRTDFFAPLAAAGGEARFFHRILTYRWTHLFRDHRKLLICDRRVAFTGGMNIADEYSVFSRWRRRLPAKAMRDTQLRMEGPAAWDFVPVFSEGWERSGGAPLPVAAAPADEHGDARILVLDSRPRRGHQETAAVLAAIAAGARETFWLSNGYFAPGRTVVAILGYAARRGLDVRLLLPGEKTDMPVVRHAGHGWYSRLLKRGVRIFEYQKATLHAKTVVADRHISVIGSSNLDFRSFRFNAECNAVVLHDGLGQSLATTFERDLEDSQEVRLPTWKRRGNVHRALDRAAGILTPLL